MEGFGRARKSASVTVDSAKEKLKYDPETGIFTWRPGTGKRWRGIRVGEIAGSARDKRGYLYIRVDGEEYPAQRLAWLLHYGEWPKGIIRFEDGNPGNCAITNLRDAAVTPPPESKHNWRTPEGKSAQRKDYYASSIRKVRDYNLRRDFDISLEEYERMHAAQNGVCAICGQPETGKRNGKVRWLAVDHCHDSKKVRGLLCGNCNPMIGYAKDDIQILEKAIEYLKTHKGAC